MNSGKMIRALAFYLPQYHPIPENDAWWGRGFTEWRNVVKARPLFKGHQQPHIPADLGVCDLRLAETRQVRADLVCLNRVWQCYKTANSTLIRTLIHRAISLWPRCITNVEMWRIYLGEHFQSVAIVAQ